MKKLSILLLALAIAAFAVPAVAGDVSMEGEYTFGGEAYSEDEAANTFYDELDLDIEVSMDDVLFHWDVEVVDDGAFDRGDSAGDSGGDSEEEGTWANIVDTMWVKWTVNDALSVKIGDHGIGWANDLVLDDVGGGTGTVSIMYALDAVDLAFHLSKHDDGSNAAVPTEDDDDTMGFTAEGEVGPAEVGLVYLTQTEDLSSGGDSFSLTGVYANFDAGPVAVAFEYGSDTSDGAGDGGTIMLVEAGLEELVGFGLTVGVVQTNEDWANNYGNDFDRVKLYEDELADHMLVYANAEYGYSDALTLGADVLLMNDVDGDDAGTEFDVWAAYAFADNVSAEFGYGSLAEGDIGAEETIMWHEWVFGF